MQFDPLCLGRARHVVVFSGAGISAESGLATFRDDSIGLWARLDPAELATARAFRKDPGLVWGWYEWRRMMAQQAQPNAAHLAVAKLARCVPQLTVITQNVDDLHERAGTSGVLHLHGSLFAPRCFACARPFSGELVQVPTVKDGGRIEPPRCMHCGGRVRPGVVWFSETLPDATLRQAFAAARECDLLLVIGTSGVVQPAARIPQLALQHGATVLHINPQPVAPRHAREFSLAGKAGEVLPALVREAFPD